MPFTNQAGASLIMNSLNPGRAKDSKRRGCWIVGVLGLAAKDSLQGLVSPFPIAICRIRRKMNPAVRLDTEFVYAAYMHAVQGSFLLLKVENPTMPLIYISS